MLRKQTNENDPRDWFGFGEERLRASDTLWKHEGLTAAGIELLQEGVERYLKGYLVAKGWALVKTHDLERLLKETITYSKAFGQFKNLASELTEEFFAQHYPGGDTTNLGQHYDRLRRETDALVNVIKQELPTYFSNLAAKPQSR